MSAASTYVLILVAAVALAGMVLSVIALCGGSILPSNVVLTDKVQSLNNKVSISSNSLIAGHLSTNALLPSPTGQAVLNCTAFLDSDSTDMAGIITIIATNPMQAFQANVIYGTPYSNKPISIILSPSPGISMSGFIDVGPDPVNETYFTISGYANSAASPQSWYYVVIGKNQ